MKENANQKYRKFLIGAFSIMIILPTVWYGLQFYYQSEAKKLYSEAESNYEKKYAYVLDEDYAVLNQTLYARSYKQGERLVKYYQEVSDYSQKVKSGEIKQEMHINPDSGDTSYIQNVIIPVPLKYLAVPEKVYVPRNAVKNKVAKVYVFNTYCWGYFVAYVPIVNLHDNLPSDSLFQDLVQHVESLPKSNGNYRRLSPYGFYCN